MIEHDQYLTESQARQEAQKFRIPELIDELYAARERIDRDEIYRRAVAVELPSDARCVQVRAGQAWVPDLLVKIRHAAGRRRPTPP
jgi:hypothetical protein